MGRYLRLSLTRDLSDRLVVQRGRGSVMARRPPPTPSPLPPEREYERLNPGAGGPPSQQQERGKPNPRTTRDDGGAAIPGSQNEDLKGGKPRGPRGATT
ncbi:MAG: hypothetical protein Q8K93_11390 [Reyranella sp.]|nr:hypothetical protein [Reyranella sp.]